MTVYLWLPHENGIEGVLAVDRRRTHNQLKRQGKGVRKTRKVVSTGVNKLNIANDNIIYVCSGPSQYKEKLTELVEDYTDQSIYLFLNYERLVRQLFNRENLKEAFSYLIIFAGIPGEEKLHAYSASAGMNQRLVVTPVDEIHAGGSGGKIARNYASKHWNPSMDLDQSVRVAYDALLDAEKRVSTCKYADVTKVTMTGFQRVIVY